MENTKVKSEELLERGIYIFSRIIAREIGKDFQYIYNESHNKLYQKPERKVSQ
jgi:hypothetical protein